jgi:hypothetical protein
MHGNWPDVVMLLSDFQGMGAEIVLSDEGVLTGVEPSRQGRLLGQIR